MNSLLTTKPLTILALSVTLAALRAESVYQGRPAVVLQSAAAGLVIDLGGGSIVDFHRDKDGLNPLRWLGPGDEEQTLRPMAHFVCLDRWGQPSKAELSNGMPYHGEATRVRWKEVREPNSAGGAVTAEHSAELPMAGLAIRRTVRLANNSAHFVVSETVTNRNKLGRVYNMVQHPTIGQPFLDETTVVDSNGRKGLMQSSPLPNPEEPAIWWPLALKNGEPVDLRRLTTDPEPDVVSFVIDDEYGWVTATTASKGMLLAYLWKKSEYPWLNIWRYVVDGKPFARGLEFGTTGLHQPFDVLTAKGSIFGHPLFTYLDTGASATRSYAAFLFETPRDFAGVASLTYRNGRITIREQAQKARELTMDVANLF